jgi:predicted lipoprotein
MVRDVRLNGFLGDQSGDDKPKQAIFWRSAGTIVSLKGNLTGLRTLFDTSGLAGRLGDDAAWVSQSIGFEFDNGEIFLDRGAGPITEVLADQDKRQALVTVRLITSHLSELFGVTLAGELGISAGFSSLDGD